MAINAVHLDDYSRRVRYKIENSITLAAGEGDWFMMIADWFREYVFQVVVPRSVVPDKWVDISGNGEIVHLKPWDPLLASFQQCIKSAVVSDCDVSIFHDGHAKGLLRVSDVRMFCIVMLLCDRVYQ